VRRSVWAAGALLAFGPLLGGCGGSAAGPLESFQPPSGVSARAHPELAGRGLRRIAVLPFRNESGVPAAGVRMAGVFYEGLAAATRYEVQPPPKVDEEDDLKFEFRLRGGRTEGVRNQDQDAAWLQERVSRFLAAVQPYLTNLEMLYPGEYFEGQLEITPSGLPKGTVARAGGPAAEGEPALDAVLTGIVTTYRNRSGGAFLGERGPQVAYSVYLVSARDGKVLWEATFNEEQIPLLDNLLLLPRYAKEGFIWQTSDMLARNGLDRVLRSFPGYAAPQAAVPAPKP